LSRIFLSRKDSLPASIKHQRVVEFLYDVKKRVERSTQDGTSGRRPSGPGRVEGQEVPIFELVQPEQEFKEFGRVPGSTINPNELAIVVIE